MTILSSASEPSRVAPRDWDGLNGDRTASEKSRERHTDGLSPIGPIRMIQNDPVQWKEGLGKTRPLSQSDQKLDDVLF